MLLDQIGQILMVKQLISWGAPTILPHGKNNYFCFGGKLAAKLPSLAVTSQ